jgi:hypothetical protein
LPKVFICHSSGDRDIVEREIVDLLESHGLSTWYSKHDIRTADEWERSILRALNECDWFLVALSQRALQSQWVRSEVHWAVEFRWGKIVPVMLEPSSPIDMHLRLSQVQYVDFGEDRETARRKLLGVWGIPFFPSKGEEDRRVKEHRETRRRVAQLPGYSVERTIGRGSLGTVFLARSQHLGRAVAIKMIEVGIGNDLLYAALHCARRLVTLRHPAIVSVYEANFVGDSLYIAMEFVDRPTLAEAMRQNIMSAARIADVIAGIAEGIHYAHSNDILHDDLKPGNIFIDDDRPRVGDFGVIRSELPEGYMLGTPAYVAPERLQGEPAGASSDIWSLGSIFYEMLTGKRPFDWAGSIADRLILTVTKDPIPPHELGTQIPDALERICLKCLARHPLQRYSSAGELAADLRHLQPLLSSPTEFR